MADISTPSPSPNRSPWPAGAGRHWGLVALRGASAVIFALLAFVWPGVSLAALVIIWGAYALIDGALALSNGLRQREDGKPLWSLVAVGALGIAAGLIALVWPGLTALALLLVIAAWAIAIGVFQIVAAIRLRKEIEGEWLLALSGLLSIAFGVLLFVQPGAGAVALAWLIASYALVFGILLLALAWRLRKHQQAPG